MDLTNKASEHIARLKSNNNHTPKTMPQFPYIPLKGYKNHSPTRQAGIVAHVPLCPDGEGQGHRDTTPHLTAAHTRAFCSTDIRVFSFDLVKGTTFYLVKA